MKQFHKHLGWVLALVVLLVPACSKDYSGPERFDYGKGMKEGLAIGTVRSQDGVRFIRLDGVSSSQVMNPAEIKDIPDGTRVFLQFRYVVATSVADFCVDAILVEWASPLDVGEIRYDMRAIESDPVDLIFDWMTSLEDGFLTLHYTIPMSANVRHGFSLYPSVEPDTYRLVHDACGDFKGTQSDGIVCFDLSGLLPETSGDEKVTLHLDYFDLTHTNKRLTFEYQSPK